ncbi:MAG: site-specific integrase, partial [Deltaproteobacteria bacterium]|nr:site-specific integrase [Deltaproteobacteria bacterium]
MTSEKKDNSLNPLGKIQDSIDTSSTDSSTSSSTDSSSPSSSASSAPSSNASSTHSSTHSSTNATCDNPQVPPTSAHRLVDEKSLSIIEEFLTHLRDLKNRSPHTITAYRYELTRYANFLALKGVRLLDASKFNLRAYVLNLRGELKNRSISRALSSIKSFHNWLISEGLMDKNISATIVSPKYPIRHPKFMSPTEVGALLDARLKGLKAQKNTATLKAQNPQFNSQDPSLSQEPSPEDQASQKLEAQSPSPAQEGPLRGPAMEHTRENFKEQAAEHTRENPQKLPKEQHGIRDQAILELIYSTGMRVS